MLRVDVPKVAVGVFVSKGAFVIPSPLIDLAREAAFAVLFILAKIGGED